VLEAGNCQWLRQRLPVLVRGIAHARGNSDLSLHRAQFTAAWPLTSAGHCQPASTHPTISHRTAGTMVCASCSRRISPQSSTNSLLAADICWPLLTCINLCYYIVTLYCRYYGLCIILTTYLSTELGFSDSAAGAAYGVLGMAISIWSVATGALWLTTPTLSTDALICTHKSDAAKFSHMYNACCIPLCVQGMRRLSGC
jgi:hypothetical protein